MHRLWRDPAMQVIDYPVSDRDFDSFVLIPIRIPIDIFGFRLWFRLTDQESIVYFKNSRDALNAESPTQVAGAMKEILNSLTYEKSFIKIL